MRKLLSLIAAISILGSATYVNAAGSDWKSAYPWAVNGVEYCTARNIMSGEHGDLMLERKITRSQTAKMAAVAFNLQNTGSNSFIDTDPKAWDYQYINSIEPYMVQNGGVFGGGNYITREEFSALIASILGFSSDYDNSLHSVFSDASKIDYDYRGYVARAVEAGIITGSNGNFRPKANLTRAEACTMIYRAVEVYNKNSVVPTSAPITPPSNSNTVSSGGAQAAFTGSSNILGQAQISVEQAQKWARSKGATDKFINIAPTYWYYGELMGIRPEVLYAQAGLETGYGKYTGVVSEDMNNWAGIKVKGRNDDEKDAHETFATAEDGARAHFNHMAAYVGLKPIGEPHDRYYSVKSMSWAGTVRNIEDLSGKWCPDTEYAKKIVEGCLIPMSQY